jgi:GTP pyrophosphokinase
MNNLETALRNLTLAPYIVKATALIGVKRKSGSNMFRHQISTLAILLDYKNIDPVLLKASVIHDLFEDGGHLPGVTEAEIKQLDSDGPQVFDLVMEVSIRRVDGMKEPKPEFLLRIMQTGSQRAKLLKLADRISNIFALGFVHDVSFIRKYLQETKDYILPYAQAVNNDMFIELSDLVESREKMFHLLSREVNSESKVIPEELVTEKKWPFFQKIKLLFKRNKVS